MNENHTTDREQDSGARFAEHLAEHYRPEPLGPVQRARFDARLFERVERGRRAPAWMPSLAGVTAALLLAWWVVPLATPLPTDGVDPVAIDLAWDAEVLLVDADAKLAEDEYLPVEYQVIALAFLDGE